MKFLIVKPSPLPILIPLGLKYANIRHQTKKHGQEHYVNAI